MEEICRLPNGCTLYRKENEAGGQTYYTDENGGIEYVVWNTALVCESTLLAAIHQEQCRLFKILLGGK